jgi:hypothetical protein
MSSMARSPVISSPGGNLTLPTERILKSGFLFVNDLGPTTLLVGTVNPPFHMFGFNAENSVSGNHDRVDLGTAVVSRQGDLVGNI